MEQYDFFDKYDYNFYSADEDSQGQFKPARKIFSGEPDIKLWSSLNNDKIDVKNSFLRACVRISKA
jgi:hypothetical protein